MLVFPQWSALVPMSCSRLALALALCLGGGVVQPGCQQPGTRESDAAGPKAEPQSGGSQSGDGFRQVKPLYLDPLFKQRAPANVAILHVRDTSGLEPQVLANLRASVYEAMMRKNYAPLNPDFVDQVERSIGKETDPATLKDKFPAEGYLVCSISLVDTKIYNDTKQVLVQGDVALYHSGTGSVLFEYELKKQVHPALETGTIKPGQSIAEAAVERFLSLCLEQLPPR